ncbi:hypothetical protein [Amycolatopsis sp. NPDC051061]|uniref:hypothetical protein n=1 Tax=Amycolatopsis sp. NPDC051061 TaxID=3155042 RepID=UPI003414CE54
MTSEVSEEELEHLRALLSPVTRLPHEAGAFAVELPVWDQVAHPDRVVPGSQCLLLAEVVGGEEAFSVELDAEARSAGNRDFAVDDARWGDGE